MGLFDAPNTLPGAPEWDAWYDLEEDFNQVEEGIVINEHSLMDVTYTSPAETDEEYKKRLAEVEQKLAEKREKHDQKRQEWLEKKNQINDMMSKAIPHEKYQEGDLIVLKVSFDESERTYCLLGRTYEFCIAQFAEKEGAGGGEFYTPASVVKTLVAVLKPFNNCRVYDPACGSGGMFVQSAKFIAAHSANRGNISVYGQEANADTWKMAKINMAIRGIDADFGPHQADTFTNDLHPQLKADFILANPPFNYHPWNQEKLVDDVRWKYGLPPAGNANYAWIQHMIHHLAPNGKIGLVLANGALSTQSSGEGEIRRRIIEDDLIEGIVALPTQLFYSVTIPVTLWFFNNNKKQKGKR